MSMKQIACVTAILMLSVFSERAGASEDQGLSAELRSVVEQPLILIFLALFGIYYPYTAFFHGVLSDTDFVAGEKT